MVNPLLLLPLLNASAATGEHDCYIQRPRGQPQLLPTSYIVCTQAINSMSASAGRALNERLAFGRTVKVGHKLPDRFEHRGYYGTCVIDIDIKDGRQDVLTWMDIVDTAGNLRDNCVARPPFLGGEGKAGPDQVLEVKMYGRGNEGGGVLRVGDGRSDS